VLLPGASGGGERIAMPSHGEMGMLRGSLARREQSDDSVKQFTESLNAVKSIFSAENAWSKSFFDIFVETVKFVHRPPGTGSV
jgi:hypothetical protein